jgi:hypothetical protein
MGLSQPTNVDRHVGWRPGGEEPSEALAAAMEQQAHHAACSRHQYVHVTYSQRVADVIGGLEDA